MNEEKNSSSDCATKKRQSSFVLTSMPPRIPFDGTFELTVRCNLHCKMCLFRHNDKENHLLTEQELTAGEWISLARQARNAGMISLLITEGEPLLRPDFREIWEGIYPLGFLTTLYTNTTLVTPAIMDTLRRFPPHRIGVTIYGASADTYRAVCGNGDAFQKAIDGIHLLQTLPSILEFRTTIIRDNYQNADAIEDLVHQEFGEHCQLTQTRIVTRAVRGACSDVDSCRLEPEDNVRLALRRSINLIKKYIGDSYCESNVHLEYHTSDQNQRQLTLLGCDAGMNSFTISWDGKLLGCQMLGAFSTDARHSGFQKAWEDFPMEVHLPPPDPVCVSCENRTLCNSCYASRCAETGRLNGRSDYICKDTALIRRLIKQEDYENEEYNRNL